MCLQVWEFCGWCIYICCSWGKIAVLYHFQVARHEIDDVDQLLFKDLYSNEHEWYAVAREEKVVANIKWASFLEVYFMLFQEITDMLLEHILADFINSEFDVVFKNL